MKMEGADALAVLDPTEDSTDSEDAAQEDESSQEKRNFTPVCRTQHPVPPQFQEPDPLKIWVGMSNRVTRWKKGSTVNFATYTKGYPRREDAVYAANQLKKAALEWNSHDVGVQFKWVGALEDAAFVLAYGGTDDDTVAAAYFPNSKDLNTVYVYKRAFKADIKADMWRFFLHELGHVLGLRHEFSMDPDPPMGEFEGGAVLVGKRNPLSVMNYREEAPEIQPSDVEDTKLFYSKGASAFSPMRFREFDPNN